MAMMAVWAAILITHGLSTGIAQHWAAHGLDDIRPLDMALNSVDDMYDGCKDKMRTAVLKTYLPNERNVDEKFKKAWEMAEAKKMLPKTLEKELAMAIYVYTLQEPNIHDDFKKAVRTQKPVYNTIFNYHALHFLLTDALQTLSAREPVNHKCYRRTKESYSQDKVLNEEIRFGYFASSSVGGYAKASYGDKSCFEITTRFGADISLYSKFGESEREVLIPPYEVFKVTEIKKSSVQKDLPCEVVYTLKSTGKTLSNLNCALF